MKERIGTQLSVQDWEQILQDFREGDDGQSPWLSQYPGLAILEQALYIVAKKEFHFKAQLLTFIEENTEVLIGENDTEEGLGSVVEALRMVLLVPTDGLIVTNLLKEQMMITATVAMVVVDCLHNALHHLETLVELLLGVINRPNYGVDRQARGVACECLRELEKTYPCLLHACAGHILFLFQSERTHVAQNYTLLLTTVLHNLACYMYTTTVSRSASANSFLSTAAPLTPFSVPSFLVTSEPGEEALSVPSRDLTPSISREFKRVVGLLLERPQLLTASGILEFVSGLIDVATVLELQGSILKLQLHNLMHTYNPLLCHIVLIIFYHFMDAFEGEEETIFKRIILLCNDPQQPLMIRLLAVHWLLGLEDLDLLKHKKGLLASMALSMYPLVYDPLSLKALKLDTLAYCAACVKPSGGSSHMQISSSEKLGAASKLFKDGVVSVSAFRWLPSWSSETLLMFRMLHRFLTVEFPHSQSEAPDATQFGTSTLFNYLEGQMVSLALQMRRLVPCVLVLVDRLLLCETHRNLGEHLLQTFNRDLLCETPADKHLPAYFPIFERIGENSSIPPGALIDLLTMYMRNQVVAAGDQGLRLWIRGSQVLHICRTIMVHHRSSRVFHPLSRLLAFLCRYFPDLEVRDTARMYLRMLVSIPGKKLRAILKFGDERIEDSSAPQLSNVSSLLRSPSPSPHVFEQLLHVASYIHLTRATTLLVGQSWSLVLHDLFQTASSVNTEGLRDSPAASALGVVSSQETDIDQDQQQQEAFDSALGAVSSEETGLDQNEQQQEAIGSEDASGKMEEVLKDEDNVPEVVKVLQKHFSVIPDYQSGPGLKIKVDCYVSFNCQMQGEEDSPRSTISGPNFSESRPALYAVVISFSTSGPYGQIPSVHIPFLLSESSKITRQTVDRSTSSKDPSIVQQQEEIETQGISGLNGKEKVQVSGDPDIRHPSVEGDLVSEDLDADAFKESVTIELEPKQPAPTIIDSHVVTSDKEGRTIEGQLDSIHVGIEDLFSKAPIPSNISSIEYSSYYLNLFNALWEACGTDYSMCSQSFLLSGGKEGISLAGTESVKLLESQADRVVDAIEHYLAPFVVTASGNGLVSILQGNGVLKDIVWQEDADSAFDRAGHLATMYGLPTEKHNDHSDQSHESQGHDKLITPVEVSRENLGSLFILIFLPPRFHILLKMDVSGWSTLIHIRTDHWPCLAYVDEYLEALVTSR